MKQKLFAFFLMCSLCLGAWAEEMTVRVLDHFRNPIGGMTVEMWDAYEYENLGTYTTDGQGEFTMNRDNYNVLEMRQPNGGEGWAYVEDWQGGSEPVEVWLEQRVFYTFHWTDRTPELEAMGVRLVVNDTEVSGWNEKNEGQVLTWLRDDPQVWWNWGGSVWDCQHPLYDASEPRPHRVTVTLGLDNYARLQIEVIGRNGEELSAQAFLQGNGMEGSVNSGMYVPTGEYRLAVEVSSYDEETNYIPVPSRQINLQAGKTETVRVDYQQDGRDVTLTVLDVDRKPMKQASVNTRIAGQNVSAYAQTDDNGVCRMVAFPGTYEVNVGQCFEETCSGGAYSTNLSLTVGDGAVEQTIDFSEWYQRLTFNVTRPAFMTNPDELQLRISDYYGSQARFPGIIRKPQENYDRDWELFCSRMYPLVGQLVDGQTEVQADLSGYKARVTVVSENPDQYRLEDVRVSKKRSDDSYEYGTGYDTQGEGMYMQPGDYRVTATLVDKATDQRFHLPSPVLFTVGSTDMQVTCGINEADFNRLTVTLIGFDGQPIDNERVSVSADGESSYSQSIYTDENGQAVFTLPDGEYSVRTFDYSDDEYPSRYEYITMDGDKQLTISYEGHKPTDVRVDGDVLADFNGSGYLYSELSIDDQDGNYKRFELQWTDGALESDGSFYLPEGNYSYALNLSLGENVLQTKGEYELRGEDRMLMHLNLSKTEYHRTAIRVRDEKGNELRDGSLLVTNIDSDQEFRGEPLMNAYLPDGRYKAVYRTENSTQVTVEEFSVAGADQTVIIEYREAEQFDLTVRVKLPMAAVDYMDYPYVYFFMEGERVGEEGVEIDPLTGEGESTLTLSAGDYTYELDNDGLPKTGTFTLSKAGQTLLIDCTNDLYLQISMTDENGQPFVDEESELTVGGISHNGYFFDTYNGYYGYFGMVSSGTYDVWGWNYGYRVAETSVTVTDTPQEVTLRLEKANPDNFTILISVDDVYYDKVEDERDLRGTISIGNFGTRVISYYNIFADIPAGVYPYTLQVEGFEPRTGTVIVDEAHEWKDENVPPHIIQLEIMESGDPSGLAGVTDGDDTFRLFPTVVDDVLHVVPATAAEGEWTVRIVSMSGVEMYVEKCDLTTETAIATDALPAGIYLLYMSNGTAVETHKFVKK